MDEGPMDQCDRKLDLFHLKIKQNGKLWAGSTTTQSPLAGTWSRFSPFTWRISPKWQLVLQGHGIPFWTVFNGGNNKDAFTGFLIFWVGPEIMHPQNGLPRGAKKS